VSKFLDLIPESQRDLPLYQFWGEVFNYADKNFFRQYEAKLRDFYKQGGPGYNVTNIFRLVGQNTFIDPTGLDADQMATLSLLVGQMDMRKGTRAALRYCLDKIEFDYQFYEWFQIDPTNPYFTGLAENGVTPGDLIVIIDLGIAPNSDPMVDNFDVAFQTLIQKAMLVALRLKLSIKLTFQETVSTTEELDGCQFQYLYENCTYQAFLANYLCATAPAGYQIKVYGDPSKVPLQGTQIQPLSSNPPCNSSSYSPESIISPFDSMGFYFLTPTDPSVVIFGYSVLQSVYQNLVTQIGLGNVHCALSAFVITPAAMQQDVLSVTLDNHLEQAISGLNCPCEGVVVGYFGTPIGLPSVTQS